MGARLKASKRRKMQTKRVPDLIQHAGLRQVKLNDATKNFITL
jgi:hypothetical protein